MGRNSGEKGLTSGKSWLNEAKIQEHKRAVKIVWIGVTKLQKVQKWLHKVENGNIW